MEFIKDNVQKFNSIDDLVQYLDKTISGLEKSVTKYSDLIGQKIRDESENLKDDPEFVELKAKIEGGDDKKKKKKPKKGVSNLWFNYEDLRIFDGLGDKGEIEIYFKSNENLKQRVNQLKKIRDSLKALMSKGLRKDLPLLASFQSSGEFEMVFLKESGQKKKFSFQSNFTIGTHTS